MNRKMAGIELEIDPEMIDSGYIEDLIARFPDEIGKQFDQPKERVLSTVVHNDLRVRKFGGMLKREDLSDRYEQLYGDRALLRVIDTCQARCSYCCIKPQISVLREHDRSLEKRLVASPEEIDSALREVARQPNMHNFLLSGGTIFMLRPESINALAEEFLGIPHVQQLYFAGSRPIFNPDMFRPEMAEVLAGHNIYSGKFEDNKRAGVTLHVNHPAELQPEVVQGIVNFRAAGVPLYSQTVLLKGINDEEETLAQLYSDLSSIGVQPYYFLHALPVQYSKSLRTSVQKGVDLMKGLERMSGHERPIFVVLTRVGKVALNGSTELNYETEDDRRYVILDTPYRKSDWLEWNERSNLPEGVFEREGRLVAKYLDGEIS